MNWTAFLPLWARMRSCGGRLGGRSCWLLAVKHNIVHCVWLQSVSEHVGSCVATEDRVQYARISYRIGVGYWRGYASSHTWEATDALSSPAVPDLQTSVLWVMLWVTLNLSLKNGKLLTKIAILVLFHIRERRCHPIRNELIWIIVSPKKQGC